MSEARGGSLVNPYEFAMQAHPKQPLVQIRVIVAGGGPTAEWMKQSYLSWYFKNESVSLSYLHRLNDKTLQLFFDMLLLRRNHDVCENYFYLLAQYLRSYEHDSLATERRNAGEDVVSDTASHPTTWMRNGPMQDNAPDQSLTHLADSCRCDVCGLCPDAAASRKWPYTYLSALPAL